MKTESKVLKVKGFEYEVKGNKVILHKDGEAIELALEFGQSAYTVCYLHLTKKTTTVKGSHKVGNFTYTLEGNTISISNKANVVIITKKLLDKDLTYIRTTVTNLLINHFE
jgi:hypothetical protein